MSSFAIENALIVSMVAGAEPAIGSVRIEDGRITHVGEQVPSSDRTLDLNGDVLVPGFIQTHIHLCQTLFRGLADDLSLLDWLRLRIWPMEAALGETEMRASADLGLLELIRGGTTTILDMGSVHHTDHIGEAVAQAGSRAFIGKAMMDRGLGVPDGLREESADSLREAEGLYERWHGQANGRIQYSYAPRFAPSCTTNLLREVGEICADKNLVIHTHCAESIDEIKLVRDEFGVSNLTYLEDCGLTGPKSVFAHMVHLEDQDLQVVKSSATSITHCPSSNCKLASGIAPIPAYLAAGINVALGADGAPCNNALDAFTEMRLAALLHKPAFGPKAMDARTVMQLATVNGAKALGMENELGTIEPGKRADLVHLRLDRPENGVAGSVFSKIVYTGSQQNVVNVWCEGEPLVSNRKTTTLDSEAIVARARESIKPVIKQL